MQQPTYSPPPGPPPLKKKKRGPFFWIVVGIIVLGALAAVGNAMSHSSANTSTDTQSVATSAPTQAAPASTPVPTAKPKPLTWTTVHTFSGNGNKKTAVFAVPNDWRIVWSCQGLTDGTGIDGVLYVSITNSDGTSYDTSAVSGTCKYGKVTTDNTEEHQSGNVYLETNTGLSWKIQVQELK